MLEKGEIGRYGMRLSAFTHDNVLTIAIKPGLLAWHDAPYNPQCEEIKNLPMCKVLPKGEGLLCNYILIDSHEGRLLRMNQFYMSNAFSNHVLREQYQLSHSNYDPSEYRDAVHRIQLRYSPREIGEKLKQAYYKHPPENEGERE